MREKFSYEGVFENYNEFLKFIKDKISALLN